MKIAIFSRWNATCGVSLHAEILGREWIRLGHKITVYAPIAEEAEKVDWHHKKIDIRDEEYVKRIYIEEGNGHPGGIKNWDEISDDHDVVLIETYPFLPYKDISTIVEKYYQDAKIVTVTHEASLNEAERLGKLLELANVVTVFDFRFIGEVLGKYYPQIKNKIKIVPYPVIDKTKESERRKKKRIFGEDKITFFSYGRQPQVEYVDYIKLTELLYRKYKIKLIYRIMRSDGLLEIEGKPWIKQWHERPPLEWIYDYLTSSDIHLLPKGKTDKTVVSSTIYQSLASLTPTIAPNTRHFELIPENDYGIGPMIKYRNFTDLLHRTLLLIKNEDFRDAIIRSAKRFVKKRNHVDIALKFIKIFKQ